VYLLRRAGRAGLLDVVLAGILFVVLCMISYEVLSPSEVEVFTYIVWSASFIYGYVLLVMGFDYNRVKYSFSLTFLSVIVALYEIIMILIGATGLLRVLAVGLAPYLGLVLLGALREWLRYLKTRRETLKVATSFTRRIRSTLHQLDRTMWFFLIFGFAYLVVFMLIPILLVLFHSFTPPTGGYWWTNFYSVLRTPSYVNLNPIYSKPLEIFELPGGGCIIILRGVNYGPVLNSIIVAAIVTSIATLLGVFVAFILARYRFPGHSLLRILAIIPLFNTPFINAYVIRLLWGEHGPVSALLRSLTGCSLSIDSLVGVIVAQIFSFYPIVYLNAYTAFINVDPSTEEQAENLGARGFRLFRTVTLPLALPGIAAGSTLVFVFSLEDLGAPIVFNEPNLMSYRIYNGLLTAHGAVSPEIAALGILMLILALVAFLAIRNYVSMRSYAMISRGGRWNPRVRKLRLIGEILVYFLVFPLVIFTALPQIGVVLMSLGILKPYAGEAGLELSVPQDPLAYFRRALTDPMIYRYFANTLVYAGVSTIIAVFLATCVAYSVSRFKVKSVTSILDSLSVAPLAIPGLVFAVGYYILFAGLAELLPIEVGSRISPASPAFEAWLVFIIAFSVRRLPYVVRSVFAGFQQIHENLEEAALNLGASRFRVVFGVILPLIVGYILSGALIGFIYMATEVSTSVTFGGIRDDQAPITYYMRMYYSGGAGGGPLIVAAMGSLLILLQLLVVVVIVYVFKQRYAFIGV